MLNMDPTRLPSYLRGASDAELATLAQQARSPQILTAVQDEMSRRGGGLTQNDMVPPPGPAPQQAQAQPPATLKDVASEGWVPPWERADGTGPFITALQSKGQVADDSGPSFEAYGRGSPYSPGNGPARSRGMSDLPEVDVGYAPGAGRDVGDDDIDLPPQTVALAKSLEEASDNPDAMQAILAEIQGSIQSPDDMRNNSIARAGFAMAASPNPYFFGALGEGGLAGMEAYEKSKQEALLNRVRSADIQSGMDEFSEQKRATGVGEGQTDTKIAQAEREMNLLEKGYNLKVQEYEEGKATDAELKKAEVALRKAQASYYSERPRSTSKADLLQDEDGNLMRLTPEGGAEYVTDPQGSKIKGTRVGSSGRTAMMKNAEYVAGLLFGGDTAKGLAWVQQGKTMAPDVRRRTAMSLATDLAAADPMLVDPVERQAFIDQTAADLESTLEEAAQSSTAMPGAPVVPTAGAAPAPAYTDANKVRADYQSGKITREDARKYLQGLGQ